MKLLWAAAVLLVSALCVDAQYFGGPLRQRNPNYGGPGYFGLESPRFGGFGDQGYPAPPHFRSLEYPAPPSPELYPESEPPNDFFGLLRNFLERLFSRLRNIRYSYPRFGGRILIAGPGYVGYLPYGPAPGYPIEPGFAPPFYGYGPFNDMPAPGFLPPPPETSPESEDEEVSILFQEPPETSPESEDEEVSILFQEPPETSSEAEEPSPTPEFD